MTLPTFEPHKDPGPSFTNLLSQLRFANVVTDPDVNVSAYLRSAEDAKMPADEVRLRHGTTCLAVRYACGVLLAGDRRATAGHLIRSHSMEKVFIADSHSGVAIAGVAGPAVEMVRLFQLQLEHYEKVEGTLISLEGKANQLGQMVRANLPAAMSGLPVIPIFAGFDLNTETGRIFEYDITGGRYEECDFVASGSGALHAQTVLKLETSPLQSRGEAVDLALKALLIAGDADTGTGGPDLLRDIFPVMAVIDVGGYRRVEDNELSSRTGRLVGLLSKRTRGENRSNDVGEVADNGGADGKVDDVVGADGKVDDVVGADGSDDDAGVSDDGTSSDDDEVADNGSDDDAGSGESAS